MFSCFVYVLVHMWGCERRDLYLKGCCYFQVSQSWGEKRIEKKGEEERRRERRSR
jgi:hypothetical protein